jgi:mitosis inhibitor protein kinase SWE1
MRDRGSISFPFLEDTRRRQASDFSFASYRDICYSFRGELWHRLREEDFSPIDGFEDECSGVLVGLIKSMMRKNPAERPTAGDIYEHYVITNVRRKMEAALAELADAGDVGPEALFKVSPLAGADAGFLSDILGHASGTEDVLMDCSGF